MVLFLVRRVFVVSALVAVFTAFTACSFVSGSHDRLLSPRLSLVGAPSRSVVFDFEISASDFETISGSISTAQSTSIVVPAGRDRRIDVVSPSDVYRGSSVFDAVAGRENRVTVPLLPGPVFVSPQGSSTFDLPASIVQIRDLDVEPGLGTTLRSRAFSGTGSPDVQYSDDGTLWFFESGGEESLVGIQDFEAVTPFPFSLSLPNAGELEMEVPSFSALSVDNRNEHIAVSANETAGENLSVLLLGSTSDEQLTSTDGVDFGTSIEVSAISGLAFGPGDTLYVLGNLLDSIGVPAEFDNIGIVKVDLTGASAAEFVLLPYEQTVFGYFNEPAWGDVRIIDDRVYVVSAAAGAGNPAIYQYDLDLNLVAEWGETTTAAEPEDGEFWGPRRFVATRRENELIVIDQKDSDTTDPELDGAGRLVGFQFDTTDGWQTFGEGEFGFYSTTGS